MAACSASPSSPWIGLAAAHGSDLQRAGDGLSRRAARVAGGEPARRGADGRRRGRALRVAARLAAPPVRRRLGGAGVADRVRRARRLADRVGDLLRRARPRARADGGERARPAAGRPDADGVGHRRAEGALPVADPLGRGDLVPGLLRARRRLGPGVAENPRGQGRRRVGRDRPEGVDQRRAVLQVVHARRAHRLGRAPSTRA